MSYIFFTLIFIAFVVFQTTWMPSCGLFDHFYDMTILPVVYLGFFRSARGGVSLILIFGIVMDAVSGGPFGTYTTSYFWSFMLAMGLRQIVPMHNLLVLPLLVLCGVLLENSVFIGTIGLLDPNAGLPSAVLRSLATQMGWAVVTGPLLLYFFRTVDISLAKWGERLKNGYA